MKKLIGPLLTSIIIGMVLGLISAAFVSQAAPEPQARKIVVFKPNVLDEPAKNALLDKFGAAKLKNLDLIGAKAVLLSPKAAAALANQPGILRIDDDVMVETLIKGGISAKPPVQPAETLPWGIDRIDADLAWEITTGGSINVAIVDTGIDLKHPDLKENLKGGVSTVWYTTSYNDDNGHGSHVAGIIAALDNEIGVIGVGPKIGLYAVKVLDRKGSGYLSDVIEGLEWIIKQKNIQGGEWAVNMSLGTSVDVPSFREAVQKVYEAGIVQVAAAGNSGGSVVYPAAYPQVIAVSATDKSDTIASWSSRGPEVDLAAPGVSIYSTYKGSTYKTLSGTSMAAPHAAGAAALVLATPTKCDYNRDGVCAPAEVQKRLEETAEDLGAAGKNNLYGSGLVDAERAVK